MTAVDRLHSLDAVRAFALLAGVVLHATVSFLPGLGATGWPIADRSPSVALGVTFYVIHIFRMTLFFLVAGFFGRMLLQRDGARGFIRNRAKRIVAPLVVGWMAVLPLLVAALAWGASKAGTSADQLLQPPDVPLWFPLTHLWFLYVLLWLYAATLLTRWGLRRLVERRAAASPWIDRAVARLIRSRFSPVLLGAPLCASLIASPTWSAWFGIPTPDQSLIPNHSAAIAFSTAFALGWLLHRQSDLLAVFEARWQSHLLIAVTLTIACLSLIGPIPAFTPTPSGWTTWLYAACYTTAVWLWTFSLIGAARRFFWQASPARRYIADASYWIYLAHLPLVFLLQVAVQDRPWHWLLKFPLILIVTLVLLLASYHFLVRPTRIGEVLNGRRYPRRTPKAAPVGAGAAPST